jgi:hypothetical protein
MPTIHKQITLVLCTLMLVAFAGCRDPQSSREPTPDINDRNGLFFVDLIDIQGYMARSSPNGFVYVGGTSTIPYDPNPGQLKLFSPDGNLFDSWIFAEYVQNVFPTPDGGVVVATAGNTKTWIRSNGGFAWDLEAPGLCAPRRDGTFVFAGYPSGHETVLFQAVNAVGDSMWEISAHVPEGLVAIAEDHLGRVGLVTYEQSAWGFTSILNLAIVEEDGSAVNVISLEDAGFDVLEETLIPTPDGEWILCGSRFIANHAQLMVAAYDENGTNTWTYVSENTSRSFGSDAFIDDNDFLFVLGTASSEDGKTHDTLVQLFFGDDRELLRTRTYGDPDTDNMGYHMIQLDDGRVQILGENAHGQLVIERDEL